MRKKNNIPLRKRETYIFIVDGQCEVWYLQMMKRNEPTLSNVSIKPELPQSKTLNAQFEYVKEVAKIYDNVIWIIDFDTINKETKESTKGKMTAIKGFEGYYQKLQNLKNVQIIVNNPCLEFWFLLHFEATGKFYEQCENVAKKLETKHLKGYNKSQAYFTKQGKDIYLRLKAYQNNAIEKAEKLGIFDFYNPNKALAEMYKLFNKILNLKC